MFVGSTAHLFGVVLIVTGALIFMVWAVAGRLLGGSMRDLRLLAVGMVTALVGALVLLGLGAFGG